MRNMKGKIVEKYSTLRAAADTAAKQLINNNACNHGAVDTEYVNGAMCGRQDLRYKH